MKTTNKTNRFRARFSQMMNKFFNIFTLCSRQPTTYLIQNPSYCNLYLISTPVIRRRDLYLSPRRINHNHLQLPFYSTNFTRLDRNIVSYRFMPEITLLDSECSSSNDDIICQVNNNDDRICENETISISSTFFSSSSSSLSSNCQSSLTIHQCNSLNTIPSANMTDIEILNNRNENMEKSSSLTLLPTTSATPSYFSYIVRPTTPCIFGGDYYDDEQRMNDDDDDEFFLTAGGIVHSCPNIYELSVDNQRKLQSCDHLIYFDQETSLLDENTTDQLNCYDTELNRYSILPRFQPMSSSISTDSFSSEFELYKERHAIGLSRQYYDNTTSSNSSSILPTTWKSDNYLVFMPFIQQQQRTHSLLLNSIDHGKRSRSFDIPIGQLNTSVFV